MLLLYIYIYTYMSTKFLFIVQCVITYACVWVLLMPGRMMNIFTITIWNLTVCSGSISREYGMCRGTKFYATKKKGLL